MGWALTPGGMPVASADEVPENTTELYACWGKETFYSSESSLQIYNGIRTATSVGGTVVYPGKSASGTGWAWENGTLTLSEGYSGGPIQAAGGLELHTTGNVTITGTDGPAISAKSKVILWTETSGKLTLQGGSGAPAVETTGTLYVHTPGHVEMTGGNTAALSANTWDLSSLYDSYSLRNRVFAGTSAADAEETSYSGQTYLRVQPVERTLIYDLQGGQTAEGITGKLEKTKYYSTAYTLDDLPEVTREGYAFMGWCTYSNGSNLWKDQYYENGDAISLTSDMTLYAIWQKIPEGPYVTLDAGSDYIDSEDCSYRPRWMLLLDGLDMAELPRLGSGCAWARNARGLLTAAVVDDPTLFYPGLRYDLSGMETMYGVAGKEHYSTVYGNGHLSQNGSPAILVGYLAGTPSSLEVYRNHFYDSEAVVVDLNTKADGSGESLYETRGDVYLQWQEAGAGSVVLYSPSDCAANDWAYRYTRVLTGDEAASFDLAASYGVSRPGWYLAGWTAQEKNGTPLTEMPEPGDENGRYYLFTAWEPWTLTCVTYSGSSTTTKSGSDGFVSVGAPTYPPLPQSLYYLGWNTKQDGTGDWYAGKWALDGDLTLYQQTAEKQGTPSCW